MKHIFLLFLATFVLIGCQPKEDSEPHDEINEDVTEEQLVTRPLYESNATPRNLEIRQYAYNYFPSQLNYYCWAEVSLGECLTELTENHLKLTEDVQKYDSPIGYPITLYYDTYTENPLPLPDKEELFIYKDGTLTPVEIVKEKIDEKTENNNFYLPEEEGIYTYIYKATYDSEHIGVAYYMFKLHAKHMTEEEVEKGP